MKIAVLVSGGVDSSVALRLLKDQGHDITAFYLKIWLEDELSHLGSCPWEDDLAHVRAVCEGAGVPLEVISMQRAYWDDVVSYTIAEIKAGRTPNPDIMCNQRVKFGAFLKAVGEGFDKVATGHYAQTREVNGETHLITSPDPIKDQTYFLSYMSNEQVSRALFPIGHLPKEHVRALARDYNLPNKDRKDSQGICFLGKLKFADFVRFHVGDRSGPLREFETGKDLGEHKGFWYYTIGQRQGIGLSGGPWYVAAKDTDQNIVYISREYHASDKARNELVVNDINWIGTPPALPAKLRVKLRHGESYHDAMIGPRMNSTKSGDLGGSLALSNVEGCERNEKPNLLHITLDQHDQGIAAGQFAVLYDGDRCLGGGVIGDV